MRLRRSDLAAVVVTIGLIPTGEVVTNRKKQDVASAGKTR